MAKKLDFRTQMEIKVRKSDSALRVQKARLARAIRSNKVSQIERLLDLFHEKLAGLSVGQLLSVPLDRQSVSRQTTKLRMYDILDVSPPFGMKGEEGVKYMVRKAEKKGYSRAKIIELMLNRKRKILESLKAQSP